MKRIAVLSIALMLCAWSVFGQTATKFFVAHQGGYIGEATVTVDRNGNVVSASMSEWQGPSDWAAYNSPDGKSLVDGAVVRVPDPLANTANTDPMIRGFMFYIHNVKEDGTSLWSQFTPGRERFARPTRFFERDFEGLMSNPIRAAAYARAAREDTLVNVTIEGLRVTVGKRASETVRYGHMDKANKNSTYMPLNANSIGYRYNNKALIDFFRANPAADFAAFTMRRARVVPSQNPEVDVAARVADYTTAEDNIFVVVDAVTGATYSDFPHYALELQQAYMMALAMQHRAFQR